MSLPKLASELCDERAESVFAGTCPERPQRQSVQPSWNEQGSIIPAKTDKAVGKISDAVASHAYVDNAKKRRERCRAETATICGNPPSRSAHRSPPDRQDLHPSAAVFPVTRLCRWCPRAVTQGRPQSRSSPKSARP